MVPFSFAGEEFALTGPSALLAARARLLVADLHLEKASFFARLAKCCRPMTAARTLSGWRCAIRETGARRVFCLGDNFHDAGGAERLESHAAGMLAALTRATDWVWVSGNHDMGRGARRHAGR
ncbi:MAG: hypothetical protein IPG83_17700 [Novosphingobium sp.]|nr:hypothetical protein [Novosphingobium sp.]